MIAELVNQYYIDYILSHKHKNSELVYNVYNQIWQSNFDGKPTDMIAVELNNAGIDIPYFDNQSGKIVVESGKWKRDDIETFSNSAFVIKMIESNEQNVKKTLNRFNICKLNHGQTASRLPASNPLTGTDFHALATTVIARRRGYVAVACQLADGVDIHALLQ